MNQKHQFFFYTLRTSQTIQQTLKNAGAKVIQGSNL
ncbi:hypothetical protein OGM84_11430 [Pediococcus acidilactici]